MDEKCSIVCENEAFMIMNHDCRLEYVQPCWVVNLASASVPPTKVIYGKSWLVKCKITSRTSISTATARPGLYKHEIVRVCNLVLPGYCHCRGKAKAMVTLSSDFTATDSISEPIHFLQNCHHKLFVTIYKLSACHNYREALHQTRWTTVKC